MIPASDSVSSSSSSSATNKVDSDDMEYLELFNLERTMNYMELEGISTLTFYDGVPPLAYLQDKLNEIVRLNPWLDGRVVRVADSAGKKVVKVRYPKVSAKYDSAVLTSTSGIGGAKLTVISSEQITLTAEDYRRHTYFSAFQKYCIKKGTVSLDKDEPVFQVVVLKITEGKFALFCSLSHLLADGHTYYKLYGMLADADAPAGAVSNAASGSHTPEVATASATGGAAPYHVPTAMITARDNSVMDSIMAIVGDSTAFFASAGYIFNILGHVFFHKPPAVVQCLVNNSSIEAIKAAHAESVTAAGAAAEKGKHPTPPFISTNDILVSSIFRAAQCDVGFMAVNFRGRVNGATDAHAGNYEGPPGYKPADFATPALIRQSIASGKFERVHTSSSPFMAGFFTKRKCRVALVTNWCSFYRPLVLSGCKQTLHIPLFRTDIPTGICVVVVYMARPGEVGVMLVQPDHMPDVAAALQAEGLVVRGLDGVGAVKPADVGLQIQRE